MFIYKTSFTPITIIMTNYELLCRLVKTPSRGHPGWHYNATPGDVTWRSLNANVRYFLRCFCLRFCLFFLASYWTWTVRLCAFLDGRRYSFTFCHCKPLIIQDSCSWPYDKTYDTQSFVGHGNRTTLGWKCHTRAAPSVTFSTSGSSYFHVPLTTTVCHLLNVGPTKDMNTTGLYKRLVEFCNCRITAEFIMELADTRGICHPSQKMFKRLLTTWRSYHCHRLLWHYFTLCILDNLCSQALPVKNQRILVELSFTVHMPFLTATSAFRLARTH